MISFDRFTLNNGLTVLVHPDFDTHLAAVNILYDVGARDEDPDRTGFAHLFEHLMFEGSEHIPHFDKALEIAGGTNNAFTNNDITNYYLTLPVMNLETAFWLESDRMLSLRFSEEKLSIQKNVVVEEFKQRYLNQPYGDAWLHMRPLVYKTHPYQWPTIGKSVAHVEEASLDEVRNFFFRHYRPNNAIMVVAGPVRTGEVKALSEKWFGSIPPGEEYIRDLPKEAVQSERRFMTIEQNVPLDALYMIWRMEERTAEAYYAGDVISDLLSAGKASMLYVRLVQEKRIFSDIHAYTTGEQDGGMLVINGKLIRGVTHTQAEEAVWEVLNDLKVKGVEPAVLDKAKNRIESIFRFGQVELLNRAMELAYFEWLGKGEDINLEMDRYLRLQPDQIRKHAMQLLDENKVSVIYYKAKEQ